MITTANRIFQVGGFSPLSFNPSLWFSDTGSNPSIWSDISGNGRNATQFASANQPAVITNSLNGRQVRRFDGLRSLRIADRSFLKNLAGCTIISVARQSTTAASNRCVFSYLSSGGLNLVYQGFSSASFIYGGRRVAADGGDFTIFGTAAINTPYIVTSIQNWQGATKIAVISNGDIDNDASFQTSGNSENFDSAGDPAIGMSAAGVEPMVGDIAELMVFNYVLSVTQRQQVEQYLRQKYNI